MKQWLCSLAFTSVMLGAAAAQAADAISITPLNVRSGPGKHYKVHAVLPPGYPVTAGSCTRYWCQVNYNGYNGWASLHYLAFKEGSPHYNNPALGQQYRPGPYKTSAHHYFSLRRYFTGSKSNSTSLPPAQSTAPQSGAPTWWNNYNRRTPDYRQKWQPRWWQRH